MEYVVIVTMGCLVHEVWEFSEVLLEEGQAKKQVKKVVKGVVLLASGLFTVFLMFMEKDK